VNGAVALYSGLAAFALALALAGATLVLAVTGRSGPARALSDIERIYAPAAATGRRLSTMDRAMRPVTSLITAIGRVLTPGALAAAMRRWLHYAGNPPGWPPERVHEAQGLGFVTLGVLGALVGAGLQLGDGGVAVVLGGLLGFAAGGLAGLGLPLLVVSHAGQKRQEKIQLHLPDTLDMLTLCVEAGLGFDAALVQVATGTRGPLAREVARALHEMQMGKRRSEALRALAERTSVLELRTIAIAVVQATELGIPIADVLREQSRDMRVRRRQRAEEKARKVPVKILFPLIFCLFPALFIVILGPGVLRIMDTLSGR
jgi:tight adherence protein C